MRLPQVRPAGDAHRHRVGGDVAEGHLDRPGEPRRLDAAVGRRVDVRGGCDGVRRRRGGDCEQRDDGDRCESGYCGHWFPGRAGEASLPVPGRAYQPSRSARSSASTRWSAPSRSMHERRLDLEHVLAVAGRLHDRAQLAQPLADRVRLVARRLLRLAVAHEVDAQVEAHAVDGADQLVPPDAAPPGPARRGSPTRDGVLLQPLVADHVEHGDADLARDRAAADGAKKLPPRRAPRRSRAVVITAPTGWPLPVDFAIVTMSGTTPCCSKAQNHAAHPPVADLHLVGDAEAAGGADVAIGGREVPVGRQQAAGVAVAAARR